MRMWFPQVHVYHINLLHFKFTERLENRRIWKNVGTTIRYRIEIRLTIIKPIKWPIVVIEIYQWVRKEKYFKSKNSVHFYSHNQERIKYKYKYAIHTWQLYRTKKLMTISNQENCRKRADPISLTGKFLETTEYYERDATSNYIFQFYIDK